MIKDKLTTTALIGFFVAIVFIFTLELIYQGNNDKLKQDTESNMKDRRKLINDYVLQKDTASVNHHIDELLDSQKDMLELETD